MMEEKIKEDDEKVYVDAPKVVPGLKCVKHKN